MLTADTYVLEILCTKRLCTLSCSRVELGSLQWNQHYTRPMFHIVSGETSNAAKTPIYRHSCSESGQRHSRLSLP